MAITGKTPQGVASKWATNLSTAASGSAQTPGSILYGANAYVQAGGNPMAAAAANPQKWITGVQNAQAKWVARLTAPNQTGGSWLAALTQKGVGRVGTGASAAAGATGKFTEFMAELLPFEQNLLNTLNAQYKRGDLSANINRATYWMTQMANFRSQNPTF